MRTAVEDELLKAIAAGEKSAAPIYADWLEDHGRSLDAEAVRRTLLLPKPKQLADLQGRYLVAVAQLEDEILFTLACSTRCKLYHQQDCCESVRIEDLCGDLQDLAGAILLQAEESSNEESEPEYVNSRTWTFYRLASARGSVTIRWLGESNGYYSESVDFTVFDPESGYTPGGGWLRSWELK